MADTYEDEGAFASGYSLVVYYNSTTILQSLMTQGRHRGIASWFRAETFIQTEFV